MVRSVLRVTSHRPVLWMALIAIDDSRSSQPRALAGSVYFVKKILTLIK